MNLLMLILVFLGIFVSFSIAYFFWRLIPKINKLEEQGNEMKRIETPEDD